MAKSSFKVELRGWKGGLVKQNVRSQGLRALRSASEYALEAANRTAPIEEGVLIGSGSVAVDAGQMCAFVGYDTVYAVRQHEDQTLRHDPGRRAKWLELTLLEDRPQIIEVIGRELKGAF